MKSTESTKEELAAWHRAYYHSQPNKLDRPWERRYRLSRAILRVEKWEKEGRPAFQASELSRLEKAARKVLTKRDPIQTKLARTLRRRFQKAFRYGAVTSETVQKLVGCTLPELRQHLEQQWQPGMTWENYGFYGWHIDHIKPVVKFDLSDPAQVAACFHFSNMQPLWMEDNFSKRDKLDCLNVKYRLRDGTGRTKTGFAFREPARTGRTSTGFVFREIVT